MTKKDNVGNNYIVTFGFNGDEGFQVVKSKPIFAKSSEEAELILKDQFESYEGTSCEIFSTEKQYAGGGDIKNEPNIGDLITNFGKYGSSIIEIDEKFVYWLDNYASKNHCEKSNLVLNNLDDDGDDDGYYEGERNNWICKKQYAGGGELSFKDEDNNILYTIEQDSKGIWTIFSVSDDWEKRNEYPSGFESKEDAIMVAKLDAGIEKEDDPEEWFMNKFDKYAGGGEVYSDSKWLTKEQWEKWNEYVKTGKIDGKKENNMFAVSRYVGVPIAKINAYGIEQRAKKNKFAIGGGLNNKIWSMSFYSTELANPRKKQSNFIRRDVIEAPSRTKAINIAKKKHNDFGTLISIKEGEQYAEGGEILGKIYESEVDNLPIAIEYKQREIRKNYPEQATYIEYKNDSKGKYAVVMSKGKPKFDEGGSVRGFYEDNVYVLFKTENDLNKVIKVLNEYGGHLNYQDQISSQGKIYHNIVGNKMVLFSNYAVDDIIELSRSYGAEIEKYKKDNTKYAEGGEMCEYSKGGNVTERRYVNKDQDYEIRYAKNRPMRKGYNDNRKFAVGGEIGNQVTFSRYGERTTGRVTDKLRNGYEVVTDEGTILVEPQEVISFSDAPAERKKRFGFFEGGGDIEDKFHEEVRDWVYENAPTKYHETSLDEIPRSVFTSNQLKQVDRFNDRFNSNKFAGGGEVNSGYNVFNYTDNIYATDQVFKTKALANKFIKEFRNRFANQGYYRDNRMNKINIQDIDLLAIRSDFNPLKKFAGGGEIEGKIEDLQAVIDGDFPQFAKDKAKTEIEKLKKELHESKETKAEEKAEHENDEVYIEFLNKEKNFKKDKKYFKTYNDAVNFGKSEIEKFKVDMVKFNDEYKETKAEEKAEDYVETKTKALEKSLKDKTISETQRKRDEKELALFKKAKPTTRKAPVKKSPVKKEIKAKPILAKADHKKLVAKLKAKKGATPSNEPSKGHKRSESSDRKRKALPLGKRISEDGNTYYENRLNRGDKNPEDKFEAGGEIKNSGWGLNLNW